MQPRPRGRQPMHPGLAGSRTQLQRLQFMPHGATISRFMTTVHDLIAIAFICQIIALNTRGLQAAHTFRFYGRWGRCLTLQYFLKDKIFRYIFNCTEKRLPVTN
jgi:hypothetical protein